MKNLERIYKTKDVDMLVTAGAILESAITNREFLETKRSTWGGTFFNDLKINLDTVIQTYLGMDNAQQLRRCTQALLAVQKVAMTDLAFVKVQIDEDFKDDKLRREELLKSLGFTSYLKDVQAKDQEALINLLFQFKTNATPEIQAELITKGTVHSLITNIISYADTLHSADVTQENFKGTKKAITAEGVTEFNKIYSSVISICKIASKIYKDDAPMKGQFSFHKVSKAINAESVKQIV
jgi:hypothetical protein